MQLTTVYTVSILTITGCLCHLTVAGSLGARCDFTMEGSRGHTTRSEAEQQVQEQRTAAVQVLAEMIAAGQLLYKTLLEQPCQVQASGKQQWR